MPVPRKTRGGAKGERHKSIWQPLIILGVILVLGVVEIFAHYLEYAAGAWLNWRNYDREAWGTLWEKDSTAREAGRQLEEETAEAIRLKREAESIQTFADLAPLIPETGGVPLTPEKTVQLFRAMPLALQPGLIDPDRLTELFFSGQWKRSAAWRRELASVIYLIDDQNRIITEITLTDEYLRAASECGRNLPGRLSDQPRFAGRIFPGERFLDLFYKTPDDQRRRLLNPPDLLLSLTKPLTAVGLSPADSSGRFGRVGFESLSDSGAVTILFPADDEIVKDFLSKLGWVELDTTSNQRSGVIY